MPKISVIVPVYNVEDFLAKCLDSIIVQSFRDFEVIIVDDGSTDNSGIIAKAYEDKYQNIYVVTQENGGLGAARNTGIDAAKGEYLLFIDSDDFITQHTLQMLNDKVEETKADLVIFDLAKEDMHGNIIEISQGCVQSSVDMNVERFPQLLLDWPSACNKCYHRDLFENTDIRFPGKVWYEDFRTIPKLLTLANRIEYINEPFYHYLQRPGSIMNSTQVARNREIIDAFDDLLSYFKQHNFFQIYHKELAYLAILHIFIHASVRVLKADRKHPLLKEFKAYVEMHFPDYLHNCYMNRLSKREKIILKFLSSGNYFSLYALLKLKNSF